MAAALHLGPALGADPGVRVPGVHLAGGIEIAIGLLGRRNQHQHAVDIGLQRSVGIGLQEVAGALNRLVDVGVIEREPAHAVRGIGLRGAHEVVVAPRLLAFAESERDGHFAAGLQARAPEGVGDLDVGERDLADRVTGLRGLLPARTQGEQGGGQGNGFVHKQIQKKGKLSTSHRYNLLPLLPSGPGGVQRELVVYDFPAAKIVKN